MDLELPTNWTEKGGSIETKYYIAENTETGVCIGYSHYGPSSFSVWVGDYANESKVIDASCDSKSEAKLQAVNFMEENPTVEYESTRGTGRLIK